MNLSIRLFNLQKGKSILVSMDTEENNEQRIGLLNLIVPVL
jgi:hypothetical protein